MHYQEILCKNECRPFFTRLRRASEAAGRRAGRTTRRVYRILKPVNAEYTVDNPLSPNNTSPAIV